MTNPPRPARRRRRKKLLFSVFLPWVVVWCSDWHRLVSRFSHFTSAAQAVESDCYIMAFLLFPLGIFLLFSLSPFFLLFIFYSKATPRQHFNNGNTYTLTTRPGTWSKKKLLPVKARLWRRLRTVNYNERGTRGVPTNTTAVIKGTSGGTNIELSRDVQSPTPNRGTAWPCGVSAGVWQETSS